MRACSMPLLASGVVAILGLRGLWTQHCSLCLCCHMAVFLGVSVPVSLLLRSPVTLDYDPF